MDNKIIAKNLLKINAVGFAPTKPLTFKSGIISPVYTDNRKLPFFPTEWKQVIEGFAAVIKEKGIDFDIVAGVESAGIPHSAALGFHLQKPSVFVRKQAKDHGTKKMIEGGEVAGKKVLLIEDLVSTGGSSLAGVRSLREAGAIVTDCLVIVSYGFPEIAEAFAKERCNLHVLVTFPVILAEAVESGALSVADKNILEDFLADPHGWAGRHGF